MKYINAKGVLPDALLEELQNYVQGGYLYIPAIQEQQKQWGELSGYRQELKERNRRIKEEYRQGFSVDSLADRYFLSTHAICKIIYEK